MMNEVIQPTANNSSSHCGINPTTTNIPEQNFSETNMVVLRDKNLTELDKQYGEAWERPVLFDEIETPAIPASLLPGVLGEFAAALANATETPEALSVMVILGTLSVTATKRFVVSPKAGWQEPVNIYTLVALPPANHKSLVLKNCIQPLVEWENDQEVLHGHTIRRERAEYKTQEKIIESLRAQTAKTKDLDEQNQLRKKVAELEADLKIPSALPNLFGNDFTPEALVNRTHEQGGRYAIFSDEGGITETLSGLYSNNHANVDILLKGIDGGDMRVGRSGKSFQLNPFLTITLTVQPVVIQNMMGKQVFKGNGLLERFLYVLPKSKLGYRTHDKPPVTPALQQAFNDKIKTLLNIQPLIEDNQEKARVLTLSVEALQIWQAFQHDIEIKLRPNGELAICQGWGGKLCGFSLRIAGLLHIAEFGIQTLVITKATMQSALQIAQLLIPHTLAVYEIGGANLTLQDAKSVLAWIQSKGLTSFTQSDILNGLRGRSRGKSDYINRALKLLIERNFLRAQRQINERKPTLLYHVNPAIVEHNSKHEQKF